MSKNIKSWLSSRGAVVRGNDQQDEEHLRRKLGELEMMLDNVDTQIWYMTDPQTYGAANQAHAEFIRIKKEHLTRGKLSDIDIPKTAKVCVDGNVEAFEEKKEIRSEVWIKDSSGCDRCLSLVKTPKLNERGQVDHLFCTAQDVTEHKLAEVGLRMQTSAINAASDQIIITDIRGTIEFANPAFMQETGYSLDEIVGKTPQFLQSGKQEKAFYTLLWNTILIGRTWHGELTNRRRDGSHYVAQMTITPIKNEAGKIDRFVAINRNITERKLFEQRMDYLAHYDQLTGLPNRLLISHKLIQSLALANRDKKQAAVLFLDLDGFKLVNDTMGHKTGDLLLKCVAERLTKCCGSSGIIARMGGDEFVIVLHQILCNEDVAKFARKVLKAISNMFVLDDQEAFISTSIGISLYPSHGSDVETLVKNADVAMYRAKELGKNSYCFYDKALSSVVTEQMVLELSLRRAIDREEFVVYYQPKVDIVTGRILGAEALVRWRHPDLGLVFPDAFIPLAEKTGLVVQISEWVLSQACAQNKAWQNAGLPPIEISVNVSARQFQRKNMLATVKKVLSSSGLEPKYLDLELTESTLMQKPELAAATLNKIREMGVRVSIDDFGTGYSSLSYLKRFPVTALKIDRSFIMDITENAEDAAITKAVIALAHCLNLKVVAEGVENLDQLKFLYELDCDEIQGYFVSAALAPAEFEELLLSNLKEVSGDFRLAA